MKVQTFLAVGGPLHGDQVTEDYAGPEYHRFNSADRVVTAVRCMACRNGATRLWDARRGRWRHEGGIECYSQDRGKPKCVLVHQTLWDQSHVQCACWVLGSYHRLVDGRPGHPYDL